MTIFHHVSSEYQVYILFYGTKVSNYVAISYKLRFFCLKNQFAPPLPTVLSTALFLSNYLLPSFSFSFLTFALFQEASHLHLFSLPKDSQYLKWPSVRDQNIIVCGFIFLGFPPSTINQQISRWDRTTQYRMFQAPKRCKYPKQIEFCQINPYIS